MKQVSRLFTLCLWAGRTSSLLFLFSLPGFVTTSLFSQNAYVDPANLCGGNSPCFTTIQAAINASSNGDVIQLTADIAEGLVTINKEITLDGNGFTLNSSSPNWGIRLAADNSTVQDLTVDGASTFGIITNPGQTDLTLSNVTVQNGGGTGFAITGVSNVTMTDITSTANTGNGISITSCQNVTITNLTTSGNAFGGGFSAGIGIFSTNTYTPGSTSGVTITGTINIGEPLTHYIQDSGGETTTGVTFNPTGGSTPASTHFAGIADIQQYFAPDLATAYSFAAGLIGGGAPASTVHVEEIASGNKYVNDDIPNPLVPPTPPTISLSIQAAIDNAQSGVTVFIEAGNYPISSTIDVTEEVTLSGPQADVDPRPSASSGRTAGSAAEAIVDGGGSLSMLIEINASNVVLNGLEIKSGTGDLISSPSSSSLSNVEVKYCLIHNATGDEGIQLRDISNGTVEYNYLFDIAQDAVNMCCGSNNSLIQFNEVTNASSSNATVYLYGFGQGMEVRNNLLYANNNNDGIKLGDGSGGDASVNSMAVISDNTIQDQPQDGISVYSSNAVVSNNTITGSNSTNGAIYLAYAISDISITGNDINNNSTNGIRLNSNVNAATVSINQNQIVSNTYGIQNDAAADVDATSNWWGDVSGPSGEGPGTGDAVSTNVLFCPWLDAAPPAGTAVAGVYNTTQVTYHCTIQDAVDNATAGDVIEISPGTYPEEVTIDRSVTLQGTGANRTDVVIDGEGTRNSGIYIQNGVTNVSIQNLSVENTVGNSNYAGIRALANCDGLNIDNVLVTDAAGRGGIYADGPVDGVTINNVEVTGSGVDGRGIVIWNGFKQNITITNCHVHDILGCCGIELQDGTASGVTMDGNLVVNVGDSGMSAIGLTSGAGPNTMSNNTITDCGRFGIEIKNPDGSGTTSGDGSIVLDNNTVTFTSSMGMNNRDHAGIAVFRRAFTAGNPQGYADIPTGVVLTNNTVDGYMQQNPGATTSEGFGIVVEGTNHTVENNTVDNCDIGIQQQGGGHSNANYVPNDAGDGDQADGQSANYFGRGNAPVACGNTIQSNTFSGNTTDERNVPGAIASGGSVENTITGEVFCTIQSAIDDADTQDGHSLEISSASFNEQVTVNKELSLTGVGATRPIINVVGLSPATDYVLQVAAQNVTLDNLHIQVDDGNGNIKGVTSTATTTFTGLTINNCLFETLDNNGSPTPNWPSTAVELGSFGGPGGATSDQVTFTNNTIQVGSSATTHFAKAVRTWNINGDFTGNTIEGFYCFQMGDPAGGPLNIASNPELRGNLELNNLEGGHSHTVSNNTFDIAEAYGPDTDFALIELKNNAQNNVDLLISGNTFQNHPFYGIFSGHSAGVTVNNNSFTPGASATSFIHVYVNTKHRTSTFTSPGFSSEITLTNNSFSGNMAASQNGIALELANHDDADDFGTVVIGSTGNENQFNSNINQFIVLNDETGTTSGHPIWGSLQVSNMQKVDQGFDASHNQYNLGSGLKLPSAMTDAELFDLEDKLQHAIDDGDLGLLNIINGEAFVTPSSFTANTLTPSIQRGIDAISPVGTVNVEPGSYAGNVDATASGVDIILSPGASPGCVTISGDLTLDASDALLIELDGTTACTDYDQLTVTGTVNLGGASLDLVPGFTPVNGDMFTIIDGSSTIQGTFAEGSSIIISGVIYSIDYAGGPDGFDVVLTAATCAVLSNLNGPDQVCGTSSYLTFSVQVAGLDGEDVDFVVFADPKTGSDVYTETPLATLGTVLNPNIVGNTATLTTSSFPSSPGTYYVYAILDPPSIDPDCRPSADHVVEVLNVDCGSFPWGGN